VGEPGDLSFERTGPITPSTGTGTLVTFPVLRARAAHASRLDPGPCPPHEVDHHSNDGDDQEQVNKPPRSVKREPTKSPKHS
jgi:hypothetical protein